MLDFATAAYVDIVTGENLNLSGEGLLRSQCCIFPVMFTEQNALEMPTDALLKHLWSWARVDFPYPRWDVVGLLFKA